MLYLIKQEGKDKNYLKIGYTQNVKDRLKAYNTHNANFTLIESIEGDKELESFAHGLLISHIHKGEWFIEDPVVYQVWQILKHEIRLRKVEKQITELQLQVQELNKIVENFN